MKKISLMFDRRVYDVTPCFAASLEIEDELGSLVLLRERIAAGAWRVAEIVTVTQILLQQAGRTVDFMLLGEIMTKDGIENYARLAGSYLAAALGAQEG